jgi:hypothetical protein
MEAKNRDERIAAALEQQFQNCHQVLAGAFAHIEKQGSFDDLQMRGLVSLMRTTAQLAGTISRIEQRQSPKHSENRGSIPQESCA